MRYHVITAFLFALSSITTSGQDCNISATKDFVDELFKKGLYVSYDSTPFSGYNKILIPLNTPMLNKLLPNCCFYSTTFFSNYYEYPNVETALVFSKGLINKSLFIHSPVFTTESKEFVRLFYNLQVADSSQAVTLAKEIMSIFSAITHIGHYNRLINLKEQEVTSFELWHNDLSWRIYDFYFDKNYRLREIKIAGGVKRDKMRDDYKRL